MSFANEVGLDFLEWWSSTIIGVTAPTPPTAIHLALSTTQAASDGTGVTEPTDGAYARVAVTGWRTRITGTTPTAIAVLENTASIAFAALATEHTFISAAAYDAATGGTFLGFGDFTSPGETVAATVPLTINAFGFVMQISL